jgi:MFS family permease
MFVWGRFVDRVGARSVLLISGLLVPIIPLIWAATTDVRILVFAEILSGLAWAGFGLSVSTYLFDSTDRSTRTRQVAEYTLLIQLAMFLGAVLGGWILGQYGKSADAFIHVFFLSAALRFIIVLAFIGVITEVRLLQVPVHGRLFRQFVAIRPSQGVVYETAVESHHTSGLAKRSPRDVRDKIVDAVKRSKRNR